MPITNENAVLIIGAGASAPFGLPLGAELIDLIRSRIADDLKYYHKYNEGRHSFEATKASYFLTGQDDAFLDAPILMSLIHPYVSTRYRGDKPYPEVRTATRFIDGLEKCQRLLTNQTSETIDDFIALNPSVAEIVKIGIASIFLLRLYRIDSYRRRLEREPISGRQALALERSKDDQPFQRRNWIHHLINLVRHGISEGTVSERNPIRIISFNYDGILESVLDEQFQNFERGQEADFPVWSNFVKIVHLHGFMGELVLAP